MATGLPGLLKEINPEAARLLQLVQKPLPSIAQDRSKSSPRCTRKLEAPGRFCWPGFAEALERNRPCDPGVLPEANAGATKAMSSTAPTPSMSWIREPQEALHTAEGWSRHVSAVPPLPKWLQRQIRDEMARSQKSKPPVAEEDAEKTPDRPKVARAGELRVDAPVRKHAQGPGSKKAPRGSRIDWKELKNRHRKTLKDRLERSAILEEMGLAEGRNRHEEPAEEVPKGTVFKAGRLVNAEKKRNVAFKDIVLRSHRVQRVQRLNHMRKQMYRGDDEESGEEEKVRKPPQQTEGPEADRLLEAFRRYDVEETGELHMRDVRSCLADIGVQPTLPQEKRAIMAMLQGSQRRQGALDYYDIAQLVPRMWEAIALAKRQDLEYWFNRSLDENSCYDVQKLRPCLEALGLRIHDEEWPEVEKIFLPICQEMKPKPKRNLEKGLSKLLFDDKALAKRPQTPQPKVSDFELFEQCFFQVQAHITRQRRRMERELCEEHNLTEEQIDEFRSDVVPLDFLFRKFDRRHSKILGEKEVLELLVASGADAQLLRSDLVPIFMREARHLANLARQKRMPKPEPPQPSITVDSVGWKKLQSKARPRVRRSFRQFEIISAGGEDINFFEFLYLIRFVREKSREVQLEKLQSFFLRLDQDECGNVTIKEAMKLFPELGLSPRSRLEQLEIKQVLNEVDEDGTGSFSWMDFTEVVQLCQERLERLARADEERFALNLNFTLERCHELRKVFLDSKNESNVLEVTDLRRAMTILQRWYTSEELLPLFAAFARDGHMDFRCFARMMHAIEILKTEGQLAQDKKPPRKSLMESMTEPLFS
mmetsp:Transcript_118013/g.280143  ORF Transcript_118013/g.280143 Transcript_118013/m.280143 type:complete len:822 (-) Transcript_118013:60-2525(-)|eukprot:CAMPEP_0181453808 /NCGR_PEP_ID=MMETSP1110-20121109/29914_1 /TAXON_ID=174948 /ORGANISM="Symbiodinium sp., Strain CCMP421" /LENGTH=821 /DNA_ID=CAMNT_0023578135 /DNA_START=40 /DNA_END=2505 /DNA_ORIENTATION=+